MVSLTRLAKVKKLALEDGEVVSVWARPERLPAPTYLPTSPLNRVGFLVQ